MICSVCDSVGLIASFFNRPMFPEFCSDQVMNDKVTYNTVVRIAGSSTSFALAFQAIFYQYGWKRVVLLNDQAPLSWCTFISSAIYDLLGSPTVIPIVMKTSGLSTADLNDYLITVQKNGRSEYSFIFQFISTEIVYIISTSCVNIVLLQTAFNTCATSRLVE